MENVGSFVKKKKWYGTYVNKNMIIFYNNNCYKFNIKKKWETLIFTLHQLLI